MFTLISSGFGLVAYSQIPTCDDSLVYKVPKETANSHLVKAAKLGIRFRHQGEHQQPHLCQECSAYVKILGLKSVNRGREIAHLDITTNDEEGGGADVKKWLRVSKDVQSTGLTELAKGRLRGIAMSTGCRVCASLVNSNLATFVWSAATEEDCTVGYKLFLNSDGVPALLNGPSTGGIGHKVTEISQITEDLRLTTRRFAVIKSAMELGALTTRGG